jgi:hypothetical protein
MVALALLAPLPGATSPLAAAVALPPSVVSPRPADLDGLLDEESDEESHRQCRPMKEEGVPPFAAILQMKMWHRNVFSNIFFLITHLCTIFFFVFSHPLVIKILTAQFFASFNSDSKMQ